MRHVAPLTLALLAAWLFAAIVPATVSAAVSLNDYEQQVLALVNAERAAHKLPKLAPNAKLTKAARSHSKEMAQKQYFSHDSFSGESFSARIISFGFTPKNCRYWKVGENIFWGAGLYASPVNVVDQWMASPSHRKVLLTKSFRVAGVGAVVSEQGFGDVDSGAWFFTFDTGRRIVKK